LTHTPVIKALKNDRLILLVDFALAALAGLGISVLQEENSKRSTARRILPWLLVAGAFVVAMLLVHELQLATKFKAEVVRRPSFSRTLLLLSLVLVGWKLIRMQRDRWFPFVACALLIFDLGTFAYGYTGFTWRDEMFPSAPVFDFLRERGRAEIFRVAPVGVTHPANSTVAYGVQSVTGFEAGVPAALQRFALDFTEPSPIQVSVLANKVLSTPDRRFDMLNLKYVVVTTPEPEYQMVSGHPDRFSEVFRSGKTVVFENKTALPRAFVVGAGGLRAIQGDQEQIEAIKQPDFDPLRTVVVDAVPDELAAVESDSVFSGHVETVASNINGYHFRVQASTPGILVVSQNFYRGWKAVINGGSASVFPADHALTGIAIPAGESDVHFEFQPTSFKVGGLLLLVSAVAFAGLLIKK
jgi:hypothetical protein